MGKIVLLLIAVLGAAPAQAGEMRRITVNGVERTYYLHVPGKLPRGAAFVIVLHDTGSNGETDVKQYGWEDAADKNQFVVAGPDASLVHADRLVSLSNPSIWNSRQPDAPASIMASDDVGFIKAIMRDVGQIVDVDGRQVYIAGFSGGGTMANRLGQEIAGRLAAISTSGGRMELLARPPSRGLPVLVSAGGQDPALDEQRTIFKNWRILNECPAAASVQAPANVAIEASLPCRDDSEARFILMQGVGHKWPTDKPIDLTQASWDFFKRFRLAAAPTGN
jgi:polyhydroxybutyrate depolymerase